MAQTQFSLIIKLKIGCPEQSLTPHPSTSDISFLSYLLPESGCHICILISFANAEEIARSTLFYENIPY